MTGSKYFLKCIQCEHITPDFGVWFEQNQICPQCGSKHSEVWYNTDYKELAEIFKGNPQNFWDYFDYYNRNFKYMQNLDWENNDIRIHLKAKSNLNTTIYIEKK